MYRMDEEEVEAVRRVILSHNLFRVGKSFEGHLNEVDNFEKEFACKMNSRYALMMSGGGTAALICGLVGMDIGPGDEVIIPSYTFIASAASVLATGAIPVVCDIDETLTIDPLDVERKISPNVKAIMPVHMVGKPADMERLKKIAEKNNIKIIEDVCQAIGGSYKQKRLGTIGDVGAFSFNYFKIISCGEGGALITDDNKIYEKSLIYHDCGANFWHYEKVNPDSIFLGLQFRASEIMGAIMRVQLKRLDSILYDLRNVKRMFYQALKDEPKIRFSPSNDDEGDCGVVTSFLFDSETMARKFAKAEGVNGWLPVDTDKHVFSNWTPLLRKKAGPNEKLNPYNLSENKNLRLSMTKDMCKKSIDILSRTVFISNNPDWKEEDILKQIDACKKAARGL